MSTYKNTTEVSGDTLVAELVGVEQFVGPNITIWPSTVQGQTVKVGDVEVNSADQLTARQLGVWVRKIADEGLGAGTLAEGTKALRTKLGLKPTQANSIGVSKIMRELAEANFGLPMTSAQQDLGNRIVALLQRGESMGAEQHHLDTAAAKLSERVRGALAEKFILAENQGDFDAALGMFRAAVGDFNRSGRRQSGQATFGTAEEVEIDVTAEEVAAWSTSVPTTDDTDTETSAPSEAEVQQAY